MKTKIAITAAASAMSLILSGGVLANNFRDKEQDMPQIEAIVSEYVHALCDFDIEKINSLKSFDLKFAERKVGPVADDCKEREGIDHIDVVLSPGFDQVYRVTGMSQTDTTVYFGDGSSALAKIGIRWESPERLLIESEATW